VGKHALLSASGAKRWLSCTPSARLEEGFENTTSSYAEEGTRAHTLAEAKVRYSVLKTIDKKQYDRIEKNIKPDTEMDEATELYVDLITEKFNQARAKTKDALLLLEARLDFSHIVPGGFGTGDAIIIADGTMEVIDLKYGKGIPVYAEDNPQARLYGLGALNQFGQIYSVEEVSSTIVQPRLDSVSTETLTADELAAWGEDCVKPRAILADAGEGEFCTGEHCRFCKAKAVCRPRAEEALSIAKHEFEQPPILSDEEIPGILQLLDKAEAWIKDIKEYAYIKALNGTKWAGFKLVEGRSNRCYLDEEIVANKLKSNGYEDDTIYTKKLKGITEMTKILKKKVFEEILGDLLVKPAGKLTLVTEDDEREAANSAKNDFAEEII
jgi:hypothetical protein